VRVARSPFQLLAIAVACLAASVALAACGSDDETSEAGSVAASPTATGAGADGTVALSEDAGLGPILVDAEGRTLYLFEKDDQGDESSCSGACAQEWPPYTTKGEPKTGEGIEAASLTTFERSEGATQIAYAEHPLYYYAGDAAPGEANGNELDAFGAEWYALDAEGQPVEGDETGESEDADDSGGYGSGY
jgi:predicted lipoprotein with Yx(FWY)xxD motif